MPEFFQGKKILLVGPGKMGKALMDGWLKSGLNARNIVAVKSHDDIGNFAPDIIFFAVKPQVLPGILPDYKHFENAIFISIAAGITIASLKKHLGTSAKICRAMPNLPVTISEGITFGAFSNMEDSHIQTTQKLFESVGKFHVIEEKHLDAITAISGSGPAYLFYFAEMLMAAAAELGLPKQIIPELVLQTIKGSALLAVNSGKPIDELRVNVTSKGGTTEAALEILKQDNGLQNLLLKAVQAAAERAAKLAS